MKAFLTLVKFYAINFNQKEGPNLIRGGLMECPGVRVEKCCGRVTRLTFSVNRTVQLGEIVLASGYFAVPKGTMGSVVGLSEPSDRLTSNLISVLFSGDSAPHRCKPKDIEWPSHSRPL